MKFILDNNRSTDTDVFRQTRSRKTRWFAKIGAEKIDRSAQFLPVSLGSIVSGSIISGSIISGSIISGYIISGSIILDRSSEIDHPGIDQPGLAVAPS